MVKSKYLVEQLIDDNVGSIMGMEVRTTKESDGNWIITAKCDYSITMDNEHWGTLHIKAMSMDTNVGNGIATAMYSIMQTVSDVEFLEEMAKEVEKAELESGEQE